MQSSLQVTDEASKAVAKSQSTRVSLDDIEANIASEYSLAAYSTVEKAMGNGVVPNQDLKGLTICLITTRSGFTVIGKSAPADPQNYDEALGRKLAREDAIRQLWPLMGFALRERLLLMREAAAI